jgi:hypothetical protein
MPSAALSSKEFRDLKLGALDDRKASPASSKVPKLPI